MRKIKAALVIPMLSLVGTVSAQTSSPSPSPSPTAEAAAQGSTLVGEVIAVVGIVVVFAIIAYAGYKMVRKWGSSSRSSESED